MELTIEQAFKQAIEAHKSGRLQHAEQLYRAILQAQSKHPDANHNLGVLAVTVGNPEAALPFLKTALETNPKQAQFWVSYIDALIKSNRTDAARQVLQRGKKMGLAGEAIVRLDNELLLHSINDQENPLRHTKNKQNNASKTQASKKSRGEPTQQEIAALVHSFNSGIYETMRELAFSMVQTYPKYSIGWKALGTALMRLNLPEASLDAFGASLSLFFEDPEVHHNIGCIQRSLGDLHAARKSLEKAVHIRPEFSEAHCDLGITLANLGLFKEAEFCFRKAISINPKKSEFRNNLGNLFRELGRFNEAEENCLQAIALKPDNAEAYNNLGNSLLELGRLEEAEVNYRTAVAINPNYSEAFSNLGNALKELDRLEEAVSSHRKAIALKPDFAEAHSNLGSALDGLGRLEEAEAAFLQALRLDPNLTTASFCLASHYYFSDDLGSAVPIFLKLTESDSLGDRLRAALKLSVLKYASGNIKESQYQHSLAAPIMLQSGLKYKNDCTYWKYLQNLIAWNLRHTADYSIPDNQELIYVIGESHALSSVGITVKVDEQNIKCVAEWIEGCKQWHLGNTKPNKFKNKFEAIIARLPHRSRILLAIGEIDCRHDEGILKHSRKSPEKLRHQIIESTVINYLDYVAKITRTFEHKIIIQGIPCPNLGSEVLSNAGIAEIIELVRTFNLFLMNHSHSLGFAFLDVYALTDRGDGISNGIWHIDDYHLSQEGIKRAWNNHYHSCN